jgi:hypothetical protein
VAYGRLWDPVPKLTIKGVEKTSLVDAYTVLPVSANDQEFAISAEGVSRAKEIYIVAVLIL